MNDEKITIVLPLPPRQLSPNVPAGTRRGRIVRAVMSKRYKGQAREAAESYRGIHWKKAEVFADFYHKTKRRRDDVNHMAMLKAAYDGIIQAGILPDDDSEHLRTTGAEFHIDKTNPRVEITLTRIK